MVLTHLLPHLLSQAWIKTLAYYCSYTRGLGSTGESYPTLWIRATITPAAYSISRRLNIKYSLFHLSLIWYSQTLSKLHFSLVHLSTDAFATYLSEKLEATLHDISKFPLSLLPNYIHTFPPLLFFIGKAKWIFLSLAQSTHTPPYFGYQLHQSSFLSFLYLSALSIGSFLSGYISMVCRTSPLYLLPDLFSSRLLLYLPVKPQLTII